MGLVKFLLEIDPMGKVRFTLLALRLNVLCLLSRRERSSAELWVRARGLYPMNEGLQLFVRVQGDGLKKGKTRGLCYRKPSIRSKIRSQPPVKRWVLPNPRIFRSTPTMEIVDHPGKAPS